MAQVVELKKPCMSCEKDFFIKDLKKVDGVGDVCKKCLDDLYNFIMVEDETYH
jgi:bacterioferritin-associated ferredoxin